MNKMKQIKHIELDRPILLVTAEEAIANLLEAIELYCPNLDITCMNKKDIDTLLDSYADCIVQYHFEDYHQERGALLRNFEMLKKYGMTDADYNSLDFC